MSERPPIHIAPAPTLEQEVNEATVEMLEEYLEKAKAGEITEAIIVGLGGDIVQTKCSPTISILKQLGALEIAKDNVLRCATE